MKNLIVALAALVSFHSFAGDINSEKISAIVDSLGEWTYGVEELKVKGKNIDEMFENLIKIDELDEGKIVNFPESIPGVDEGSDDVGLITREDAIGMFSGYAFDGNGGDRKLTEKQERALKNMFGGLEYAGAQFGYSGHGGGVVCGVSWPGLLVIDTKAKKIYRFIFVGGDC